LILVDGKIGQVSDILNSESEFASMANEREACDIVGIIFPPIAGGSVGPRQKADSFIVADGRHFDASAPRGFAYRNIVRLH